MQGITYNTFCLKKQQLLRASMELPKEFDVIVVGTGLEESMVAASAARNGHTVLHVDTNDYYGDAWSAFNFEGMQKWIHFHQEKRFTEDDDYKEKGFNESINTKTKESDLNSFLSANERLVQYDSENIDNCISDVYQNWHFTNEQCQTEISESINPETNVNLIKDNTSNHTDTASKNDVESKNLIDTIAVPLPDKENDSVSIEGNITTKDEIKSPENSNDLRHSVAPSKEETSNRRNRYPWTQEKITSSSRHFNLDLVPRLLYARGAMVDLLIDSNISRYTEFKSVSRVLTKMPNGSLEQVPSSRSDVFATKHVSVVEKRILMKFMNFCVNYESQPEIYESFIGKTYLDFLKHERLTENLIHFVLRSIAMGDDTTPCLEGLKSTKKFLSSLGRFGNTPFLWSMYGSGELPQAFCRLCAVFGGTYYLGNPIDGIILNENKIEGIITNGQRISCKYFVIGVGNCPRLITEASKIQYSETILDRKICLLSDSILPSEREQLTFASIPPPLDQATATSVHLSMNTYVQEVGYGPSVCPKGMYVLHMTRKQANDGSVSADLDVSSIISDPEILLWSLDFKIRSKSTSCFEETKPISNIYFCDGPYFELDYDSTIAHAKVVCKQIYPEEEFLPRAPDPEEIIIGGGPPSDENINQSFEGDSSGIKSEPNSNDNVSSAADGKFENNA